MRGEAEPLDDYYLRYLIAGLLLLSLIFVVMMLLIMLMYWCLTVTSQSRTGRKADIEAIMKQGRLMSLMSNVPYSKLLLLDGERDCPICLMQFTDECQVVQLKCNEYHIFHYKCLEKYLSYPNLQAPGSSQDPNSIIK